MFFGNMQSFYRRNSLHNQSPNHPPSGGHASKEHGARNRRASRHMRREVDEEQQKNEDQEFPLEEINRPGIPIIKIGLYDQPEIGVRNHGEESKEHSCFRTCPESDNSVRLGPNKNNIIKESLMSDLERQTDCGKR